MNPILADILRQRQMFQRQVFEAVWHRPSITFGQKLGYSVYSVWEGNPGRPVHDGDDAMNPVHDMMSSAKMAICLQIRRGTP